MSAAAGWLPAVALLAAFLLLAGRRYLTKRAASPWWVSVALAPAAVTAATGALLAWAVPEWVASPALSMVHPVVQFLAGWVGLQIGCGLDLRALRRVAVGPLLYEGIAAVATLMAVFTFAFTVSRLVPGAPAPLPTVLLALAGFCVAGPAMPAGGAALSRAAGRGGFWQPSAAGLLAALLAAAGSAMAIWPTVATSLPGQPGEVLIEFAGAAGRLLGMVAVGCVAGLVADLASKDDFAPGGLFPQLAAVVLIAAGVAGTLGLETMLVMAVAGFWLVNATLRRLDILHVLQRGAALPRLLTPFLGGWIVGAGLRDTGMETGAFAVVLVLVLALRPASRLAGRRLLLAGTQQGHRGRRPEAPVADLVDVDALGLLIVASLTRQLEPETAIAVMAATLLAQWLLGLGAGAWDQRVVAEASRPKAARPG